MPTCDPIMAFMHNHISFYVTVSFQFLRKTITLNFPIWMSFFLLYKQNAQLLLFDTFFNSKNIYACYKNLLNFFSWFVLYIFQSLERQSWLIFFCLQVKYIIKKLWANTINNAVLFDICHTVFVVRVYCCMHAR